MIAQMDEHGRFGNTDTVAVRCSDLECRRSADANKEMGSARMRLERLTDLGVTVPGEAMSRGIAANAEDLADWRSGALSRVWEPHTIETLLIGIASIGDLSVEDPDAGKRCLIVFVALTSDSSPAHRPGARTLAALLPLIAERAALAMPPGPEIGWLTEREQNVLDRLTLGRSVREIAEDLDRSPHTVHDHVKSLHRKLSASSRGELVARALGHNPNPAPRLDPVVIERARASTIIEPSPGLARRVPTA